MLLTSTFIHINNIGYKKERQFWESGILSWEDYFLHEQPDLFLDKPHSLLYKSKLALDREDINFFASNLKPEDQYRLALTYPKDVMFLDIETTGLSQYYDYITIIGWSINGKFDFFVNGIDTLDKFIKSLSKAKSIVTFNGKIFDIPFIKSVFSSLNFPLCHIDLRFFSKKAKLSGGQKKIENSLGIVRPISLTDMGGFEATILWDEYKWGEKSSLIKLIKYNHSDIEGMKSILDYIILYLYKEKKLNVFFDKPISFKEYYSASFDSKFIERYVLSKKIPFDPKSVLNFKQLSKKINGNAKIIGIDLTGSESKSSGIAYLKGNKVTTCLINLDDDIIKYIHKIKPHLVSIDSPLSLPYGRTTVFDDDPNRDKFGILRECERILKRRGINVYPTLIPSMQKLTKRGIELSEKLRRIGIPVIESYPGVVQDIIGLPRKQASLVLLKEGLGKFGLDGDFLKQDISHDELDAITSAIVGLFFFSGDYEAIGNRQENLMIIPDLNTKPLDIKVLGCNSFNKKLCNISFNYRITKNDIFCEKISIKELKGNIINKKLKGTFFKVDIKNIRDHSFLVEEFGGNYIILNENSREK